uniref:Uncharacterized protein n=1 Tax=viral metagenome TaxID=1070528 RepID=A0A6C0JWG4_9ZZZZ
MAYYVVKHAGPRTSKLLESRRRVLQTVDGVFTVYTDRPHEIEGRFTIKKICSYDDLLTYVGPEVAHVYPTSPVVYLGVLETQYGFIHISGDSCITYCGKWDSAPTPFINSIAAVVEVCKQILDKEFTIAVEDSSLARLFNTMTKDYSDLEGEYKDLIDEFTRLTRGKKVKVINTFSSYMNLLARLEAKKGTDYSYSLQPYYDRFGAR